MMILIVIILIFPIAMYGQTKVYAGCVTDTLTGDKLPLATVRVLSGKQSAVADIDAKFTISALPSDSLSVSYIGYNPFKLAISDITISENGSLCIKMMPNTTLLKELIVKPGKIKYSKKNNPAYDLMVKVRKAKKNSDPSDMPYYSHDYYRKISLGLNNYVVNPNGRMGFMADYADTAKDTRKPVVLVSVKEKAGTILESNNPKRIKDIVTGIKSEGIDKSLDQENIQKMLEEVFRDVDIYQNDVTFLTNRFLSPLGPLADDNYHFFITDTLKKKDGSRRIELSFAPRNESTFAFNGKMWVDDSDSLYFIDHVKMRVPHAANINYVDNIYIEQFFERDSLGRRHKTLDDMTLELQIIPGTPSFYARRITANNNFSYLPNKNLQSYYNRVGNDFIIDEAPYQRGDFWNNMRMVPLSRAEINMGSLLSKLRLKPWFYWTEKVVTILFSGYWSSKETFPIAFGPINTLVSYNSAEGWRFRVGGLTTAYLSKNWFGRGYVAYGIKDRKWKYLAELEYSFNDKKKYAREFPVNSIRATYKYDVDMIGQHYLFTNQDNFFLSLKRKSSNLVTYQRMQQLEYQLELNNNFSVTAGLRHERQYATPWLPFVSADNIYHKSYSNSLIYLKLRWAPGEKFTQGKTQRQALNMDAPEFQITHEYGPRGIAGSNFTVNRTEISARKRFWFSAFGYLDAILAGGIVWNQVQYPMLMWPNANLSYTIQPESYSLMNAMEFANDKYASLDLTYWANGALFNLIPGFKKLKWREVVNFKGLFGGISKHNDPKCNSNLYRFPAGATAMKMTSTPYMEVGVGIDNIFTILRVDYVWRLTYRDNPNIDKSGVRVSLHLSF